jgi:Zn-dependent protease with chaperone function
LILVIIAECLIFAAANKHSMENILIVLGILIIGSALGGTQLPKLPGAILSLGALVLAFFNSNARDNMASLMYIIPLLFFVVGIASYFAEKKLIAEGENASSTTKLLGGSIFQVIFIFALTMYFVSTFYWPFWS